MTTSHAHAHAEPSHDDAARMPIATPPEAGAHASHAQHERTEVKAPEASTIEHHAKAHVSPHAVQTPVAVNDNLVITNELRDAANQKLADFIADKISAGVIDPSLRIKLVEDVNHGHAGIKICLSGDKLEGNHALLGKQIEQALQQHPVFAPFYKHENTRPHFRDEPDKPNMVHVHIPNLTLEQYHGVFEALVNETLVAPVVPHVAPVVLPSPGAAVPVKEAANDTQADVITHPPVAPGNSPRELDAAPTAQLEQAQHEGVLAEKQPEVIR